MLCCHSLEIFPFWTWRPMFSICTGPTTQVPDHANKTSLSKGIGTIERQKGPIGVPECHSSLAMLLQVRHLTTIRMNVFFPHASWSIYKCLKFRRETSNPHFQGFSVQSLNVHVMGQIKSICFRFIYTLFIRMAPYPFLRRAISCPRSLLSLLGALWV